MSTLGLRPDEHGGFRPMERWSNSAMGSWGSPYQQVLNVLEPASMSPSFVYSSQRLQAQSTFPQLMRDGAPESALVQAFVQAKVDSLSAHENVVSGFEYNALLQSSNSTSMVESSTTDEDCTAPEIRMNCISALGGGPVSPVVVSVLDRTGSTGASLMAQEDFLRMHHPAQTASPRGGPCRVSDDSLHGASATVDIMAGLKRRYEAGDEEYMNRLMQNVQQCEIPGSYVGGGYADQAPAVGTTVMRVARTPSLQKSDHATAGGSPAAGVVIDSLRAIVFRHASQPVPTLEEIASTRPKRRNVRISRDPQSVAARHRRERISDRVRVLQRLVPGGTKMDTASMLDEAIHYVKFLKLQLQTLEQIGNNGDAQSVDWIQLQGTGDQAQLGSMARRPFDLNCAAAFQAWPLNNHNHNDSSSLQRSRSVTSGPITCRNIS